MEFRFNLNQIFKEPIVEIGNSLIPPGFTGDKRALWDTQAKITQIVNAMGEASANAQGLSKPITTADRLRNSEHKLYLLIDHSANSGKGSVTGMLKVGEKGLYVFDREGQHYQVSPPCVLDFYIHESRQRSGYGKSLFEHMLQTQQIEPVKMAVDRPSDKLLGFLNKHYGLDSPVKQMNNYVVYDGFFPKSSETPRTVEGDKSYTPSKKQSANGLQHGIPSSPYGRYGAPRPPCSMGQIIHNDSAVLKRNQEPTGVRSEPITNIQGQNHLANSNQTPTWQVTQSVPNMHTSYFPNQQSYAQTPQQQASNQPYFPNPQYEQFQQFPSNSYIPYQLSSGDHPVNRTSHHIMQPVEQNQVPIAQGQNQTQHFNQHADENYRQTYSNNYTLGQGDATGQSYKDQNVIASTAQEIPNQNVDQIQCQQMFYPNDVQAPQPMTQSNNIAQNQPQIFTYQDQTYCYNPQTRQYQIIPLQNQQICHNQDLHQYYQTVREARQSPPQQHREPLQPQNFDGTVRKVQQSVSTPLQRTGIQDKQNMPARVQESVSAPISYQHRPVMAIDQDRTRLDQAYNAASIPQILNETHHQHQLVSQVNPRSYYHSGHTESNLSRDCDQNTPAFRNTNSQNLVMPEANSPTVGHVISQTSNVNQRNEIPTQPIQIVQHAPLLPVANVQQENMFQTQMRQYNQANSIIAPQNQAVSQMPNMPQRDDQNLKPNPQNMVEITQSGNVITDNSMTPSLMQPNNAIQPMIAQNQQMPYVQNFPSVSEMAYPINDLNQRTISENQQMLDFQQVSTMPQAQSVSLQPQQQQMIYQHPHLGTPAHNLNTGRQAVENGGILQGRNRNIPNEAVPSHSALNVTANIDQKTTRHIRQDQEIDLSKGYPPQHHEKPAQNSTPKADRPQSLNIETAEDLEHKNNDQNETNDEIHEEPLDGDREDSLIGEHAALEEIEQQIEELELASKASTPVFGGLKKSPDVEAAGIVTPGRNTPGLTDQGYFDLKFYHNKLCDNHYGIVFKDCQELNEAAE